MKRAALEWRRRTKVYRVGIAGAHASLRQSWIAGMRLALPVVGGRLAPTLGAISRLSRIADRFAIKNLEQEYS